MKKKKVPKSSLPELAAFIPCDAVVRDPNSGKFTLYGVFDKIITTKIPAVVQPFSVFVKLRGGKGKHQFAFEVLDPDNKPIQGESTSTPEIQLQKGFVGEIIVQVNGAAFQKVGEYKLTLKSGDQKLSSPYVISVEKKQ